MWWDEILSNNQVLLWVFLVLFVVFCFSSIRLYFCFYFIKNIYAWTLHICFIILLFIKEFKEPKSWIDFFESIIHTFILFYIFIIIFVLLKGILLDCNYIWNWTKTKFSKNKNICNSVREKKLWFKYDKKWSLYFRKIIPFDEESVSSFFLDSPQGSGKTTFVMNLKNEIMKNNPNDTIISIDTADFDQENKPLFLIIKKILEAKLVSRKNYIELEFLTWKGTINFLNSTFNNDPNNNVDRILNVFKNQNFKWKGNVFVLVDELDRINHNYLLTFLTFMDDIFKENGNVKIVYLIDQESAFKRMKSFSIDYSNFQKNSKSYKKFLEKYWEYIFDLKFYFHNFFERINQTKINSITSSNSKTGIKNITVVGQIFSEFISGLKEYENIESINIRKYIKMLGNMNVESIKENLTNQINFLNKLLENSESKLQFTDQQKNIKQSYHFYTYIFILDFWDKFDFKNKDHIKIINQMEEMMELKNFKSIVKKIDIFFRNSKIKTEPKNLKQLIFVNIKKNLFIFLINSNYWSKNYSSMLKNKGIISFINSFEFKLKLSNRLVIKKDFLLERNELTRMFNQKFILYLNAYSREQMFFLNIISYSINNEKQINQNEYIKFFNVKRNYKPIKKDITQFLGIQMKIGSLTYDLNNFKKSFIKYNKKLFDQLKENVTIPFFKTYSDIQKYQNIISCPLNFDESYNVGGNLPRNYMAKKIFFEKVEHFTIELILYVCRFKDISKIRRYLFLYFKINSKYYIENRISESIINWTAHKFDNFCFNVEKSKHEALKIINEMIKDFLDHFVFHYVETY